MFHFALRVVLKCYHLYPAMMSPLCQLTDPVSHARILGTIYDDVRAQYAASYLITRPGHDLN